MIPEPLHPAVVHFPIVLMFLAPISAVAALWAIRRGARPRRAWALPVALAAALSLSAWAALATGEAQEDRVERVVGEDPLHEHEEAAEVFLTLAGVLALTAAGGLVGGTFGRTARLVATLGAFGVAVAGAQVGRTGGDLVYRHGAASAWAGTPSSVRASGLLATEVGDEPDEREEGRRERR